MDHRQPQPGPLSDALCGEKRLENASVDLRHHPSSGVRDGQQDVPTALNLNVRVNVRLVQFDVLRLDRQFPPSRHGVTSVHTQVHQHLSNVARISQHPAQAGVENRRQQDILTDHPSQQFLGVLDNVVEV